MRILAAIFLIASAGLIAVVSSHAMPVGHLGQNEMSAVIKVIEGCGPNVHRGPYGHCRARYSCPAGWHPGPYGWHCFRN